MIKNVCKTCDGTGVIHSSPDRPGTIYDSQLKCPACKGSGMEEAVNHPVHYNAGKFEVIDVIEDWGLGFHAGNVIKYIGRYMHKNNPLEDLKKAKWYLDRLIEHEERKRSDVE